MALLTPSEAAPIAGVPASQLERWAYLDWDAWSKKPRGKDGPRNCGTRFHPRYDEDDVREWRHKHDAVLLKAVEDSLR